MKIYAYLVTGIVMLGLMCGCDDDDSDTTVGIRSLQVLNDERAAFSARVKLSLNRPASVVVQYWLAAEDESHAMTTSTSEEKQEHLLSVYRLEAGSSYRYRVVDAKTNAVIGEPGTFTTASIPAFVTTFYKESENTIEESAEGYYLFHNMVKPAAIYLVDKTGKMVWYRTSTNMIKSARFTSAKTLITLQDDNDNPLGDANVILETTLAGDTLFYGKLGQAGFDQMAHHDVLRNGNGHLVVVTNVYKDGLPGDGIIVLSRQGQKLWQWNTFDVLTDINPEHYAQPWLNSLTIDSDGNYIASFRSLCQVWKINASSGAVMWKLGKGGDFEMENEEQFQFQHFAHRNGAGDIMLFDNGSDTRPSSRALSFSLNETTHEATLKLNTVLPDNFYSRIMGSATFLSDNTILAASAVTGHILKMDTDGDVIWKLKTTTPMFRVEYVVDPFE